LRVQIHRYRFRNPEPILCSEPSFESHPRAHEVFAFRARLSRNYVSDLERGRKSPSLPTIEALARALGVKAPVLIEMAEEAEE
jgi:transcriptional regulator with XRE-family HTH domain